MAETKNAIATPIVVREIEVGATPVAAVSTALAEMHTQGCRRVSAQIINSGANPFTGFLIQMRPTSNSAWETLASVTADFTSPKLPFLAASGDLTGLAAGATGWFFLETGGMEAIRISATSALTTVAELNMGGF